ncbi:Calmodulin-regulated spectrin-associated protein 2 [Rhizophlyctis rosea]|nr:Calmodulin-regulated spectrin-associated protein 2 [Rhizophlyctis rosea]
MEEDCAWLADLLGYDDVAPDVLVEGFVLLQLLALISPAAADLNWYTSPSAMTMDPTDIHQKTFCDLKTGMRKAGISDTTISDDVLNSAKEGSAEACATILGVMRDHFDDRSNGLGNGRNPGRSSTSRGEHSMAVDGIKGAESDDVVTESDYECMEPAFKPTLRWLLNFVQSQSESQLTGYCTSEVTELQDALKDETRIIPSSRVIPALTTGHLYHIATTTIFYLDKKPQYSSLFPSSSDRNQHADREPMEFLDILTAEGYLNFTAGLRSSVGDMVADRAPFYELINGGDRGGSFEVCHHLTASVYFDMLKKPCFGTISRFDTFDKNCYPYDLEDAFLAWINQCRLHVTKQTSDEEEIEDFAELSDGRGLCFLVGAYFPGHIDVKKVLRCSQTTPTCTTNLKKFATACQKAIGISPPWLPEELSTTGHASGHGRSGGGLRRTLVTFLCEVFELLRDRDPAEIGKLELKRGAGKPCTSPMTKTTTVSDTDDTSKREVTPEEATQQATALGPELQAHSELQMEEAPPPHGPLTRGKPQRKNSTSTKNSPTAGANMKLEVGQDGQDVNIASVNSQGPVTSPSVTCKPDQNSVTTETVPATSTKADDSGKRMPTKKKKQTKVNEPIHPKESTENIQPPPVAGRDETDTIRPKADVAVPEETSPFRDSGNNQSTSCHPRHSEHEGASTTAKADNTKPLSTSPHTNRDQPVPPAELKPREKRRLSKSTRKQEIMTDMRRTKDSGMAEGGKVGAAVHVLEKSEVMPRQSEEVTPSLKKGGIPKSKKKGVTQAEKYDGMEQGLKEVPSVPVTPRKKTVSASGGQPKAKLNGSTNEGSSTTPLVPSTKPSPNHHLHTLNETNPIETPCTETELHPQPTLDPPKLTRTKHKLRDRVASTITLPSSSPSVPYQSLDIQKPTLSLPSIHNPSDRVAKVTKSFSPVPLNGSSNELTLPNLPSSGSIVGGLASGKRQKEVVEEALVVADSRYSSARSVRESRREVESVGLDVRGSEGDGLVDVITTCVQRCAEEWDVRSEEGEEQWGEGGLDDEGELMDSEAGRESGEFEDLPIWDVAVGEVGGEGYGMLKEVTLNGGIEKWEDGNRNGEEISSVIGGETAAHDDGEDFQTAGNMNTKEEGQRERSVDDDGWETDEEGETVTSKSSKRTRISSAKRRQSRFKVLLTPAAPRPTTTTQKFVMNHDVCAAAAEHPSLRSDSKDVPAQTINNLSPTPPHANPPVNSHPTKASQPRPPITPPQPLTTKRHKDVSNMKFDSSDSENDDSPDRPPETVHQIMAETSENKTEISPHKGGYSVQKPEERRTERQSKKKLVLQRMEETRRAEQQMAERRRVEEEREKEERRRLYAEEQRQRLEEKARRRSEVQSREQERREESQRRRSSMKNSPSTTRRNSEATPTTKATPSKPVAKEQSNRQLIRNALVHVCLAGAVNEKVKEEVLEDLADSPQSHFIILFKNPENHTFRGLYSYDPVLDQALKVYAGTQGPDVLDAAAISAYYKYDSGARTFRGVPTKSLGRSVHAVAVGGGWGMGRKGKKGVGVGV